VPEKLLPFDYGEARHHLTEDDGVPEHIIKRKQPMFHQFDSYWALIETGGIGLPPASPTGAPFETEPSKSAIARIMSII
jgi:hypothetical protein